MTTATKTGQGSTDANNRNTFHAADINATISLSALESLMATSYDKPTTTQPTTNGNIIHDTGLVRIPSMPNDPAISAVLAPFLYDFLQDTGMATATTGRKRVFKANKTGEKYTETEVLGEGVYKVVDRFRDHCVVKAPKETLSVTLIQQEIHHLEKLRGHRNVVQYFGVVYDSDGMYLRQELCLPRNLASLMAKRKFLTEPEVRYFGKQIVEGVRAIHRNKIIHRDLNPGNILVGDGMVLKISSFGSSVPMSQKYIGFIGLLGFVAPEVVKREKHTTGMDIFSIGIIMYMMFNCKRPHITDKYGVYPPPGKFYKKIRGSRDAREFIRWALKIDPKTRALIMDLAFHDFLKDELCPMTLPESVFDTAPVLEDIIYDTKKSDIKKSDSNKREAGEIGSGDGKAPAAVGLDDDGRQKKVPYTATLAEINKRRRLDTFTDKEKTDWDIKDLIARKRELNDWWKMTNARMQVEANKLKAKYGANIDLNIPPDDAAFSLNLGGDDNLTLS
ncbi:hypothetical protein EC957_001868 [Mortierella hygrophila]|uniref:Protein kinase domain-containing protein n=1 Tax=Mortierella hygrophila TaxID=979708 RepID=A0A9P6F636_9FUNG|nr:hypothetical protein EC957_001868 [Mortierella hygrophila]